MRAKNIDQIITSAQQKCVASGARLTEKRQHILKLMLESDTPLSPYEVVERYNAESDTNMPANSAYRILDFLAAENLAHKLSSANKYVACSHIACSHQHSVSQFLICKQCQRVEEIMIKTELMNEIERNVLDAGYQLLSSSVELDCLCAECAAANSG